MKNKEIFSKLQKHKERIIRQIEYRRLKRVRRKKTPQYTYCKNCGKKLKGMYCSQCGQYALDIEQPFWKYLQQYFENVYQFDSKVWLTLYYLFRRPGFLTREFNAGKINSYVHPLRLFMFLSCLFFIFAFSLLDDWKKMQAHTDEMAEWEVLKNTEEAGNWTSYETVMAQSGLEDTVIWTVTDTAMLSSYKPMLRLLESPYQDTFRVQLAQVIFQDEFHAWEESDTIFVLEKDSVHQVQVDVTKKQKRELKDLRSKWKYNRLVSWYSSNWPLIALLLIPIFALLLMLFFRKEKLGYMSHLVFALHLHSVLLIISAVMLILLWQGCHLGAIYGLLWIYFLVYSIIAVRRVYSRSSWGKAILKTFLLYGSYWIVWFTVFILSLVWISKNVLE
mgnify:FL=1